MAKADDKASRHANLKRLSDDHLDQVVGGVRRYESEQPRSQEGQLHDAVIAAGESQPLSVHEEFDPSGLSPSDVANHNIASTESLSLHFNDHIIEFPATEHGAQILERAHEAFDKVALISLPAVYSFK